MTGIYGSTVIAVAYGFTLFPGTTTGSSTCPGSSRGWRGPRIELFAGLLILPVLVSAQGVCFDGMGWTALAFESHCFSRYLASKANSANRQRPPPADPAIIGMMLGGPSSEKYNDKKIHTEGMPSYMNM